MSKCAAPYARLPQEEMRGSSYNRSLAVSIDSLPEPWIKKQSCLTDRGLH